MHPVVRSMAKEALMKRSLWVLGALLVPAFAAHLALAAGFFKVGEKAPSFTLTAITGETVSQIGRAHV